MADLRRKFFKALEQELSGGYPGVVRAGGPSFRGMLRWFKQFGDDTAEEMVEKGKRVRLKPGQIGEAEDLLESLDELHLEKQAEEAKRAKKEFAGIEFSERKTEDFGIVTEGEKVFKEVGEEAPYTHAWSFNLAHLDAPDDVLDIIKRTSETIESPKITLPWAKVEEAVEDLARTGGLDAKAVLKWTRKNGLNVEQLFYAKALLRESAETVQDAMEFFLEKQARGTLCEADRVGFIGLLSRHISIQKAYSGMAEESGRLLGVMRNTRTASISPVIRHDIVQMFGGDKYVDSLMKVFGDMTTPEQINRVAKEITRPGAKDMLYEIWINGILSGIRTHEVNFVGSGLATMFSNMDQFVAGAIGDARALSARAMGREAIEHASMQDVMPYLYGELRGTLDGVRLMGRAFKKGDSVFDSVVKMESSGRGFNPARRPALTTENLAAMVGRGPPDGALAKGLDYMFDFSPIGGRLPTRMLVAEDDFWKAVNYRAAVNTEAYRLARKEAQQQGVENVSEYMGKRIPEIIADMPPEIHEAAMKLARTNTFTSTLEGPIWGNLERAAQGLRHIPVFGKYIVPFARTPINLAKWVFDHTPAALLDSNVLKAIKAGGAGRDLALAKITTGSTFLTLAGLMSTSGFITGAGPDWKTQRGTADALLRLGRTKRSLRIPAGYAGNDKDEFYDISRLDPVGMLLTSVADAVDLMRYAPDDQTSDEIAMMVTIALAENFTDKTYLTGVADFFDAWVSDPRRFVQGWTERMAGSFVPTIVTDVNRHFIDKSRRDVDGVIESYKSRLPGLSKGLPPRRNLWGYPIELDEFNMFSPIQKSTLKMERWSPLDQLIIKNHLNIGPPSPTWHGLDLREYHKEEGGTTRSAYDRYMELAGHALMDPASGMNLVDSLLDITQQAEQYPDLYTPGPDGTMKDSFQSEVNYFRELAREQIMEEFPDLARDVMTRQEAMDAAKGFVTGD